MFGIRVLRGIYIFIWPSCSLYIGLGFPNKAAGLKKPGAAKRENCRQRRNVTSNHSMVIAVFIGNIIMVVIMVIVVMVIIVECGHD